MRNAHHPQDHDARPLKPQGLSSRQRPYKHSTRSPRGSWHKEKVSCPRAPLCPVASSSSQEKQPWITGILFKISLASELREDSESSRVPPPHPFIVCQPSYPGAWPSAGCSQDTEGRIFPEWLRGGDAHGVLESEERKVVLPLGSGGERRSERARAPGWGGVGWEGGMPGAGGEGAPYMNFQVVDLPLRSAQ